MFKGKGTKKIEAVTLPVAIEIAQNGVRVYLRRFTEKLRDKELMKDNAMKLINQAIFNHYLFTTPETKGRVDIYQSFSCVVRLKGEVIYINNDKKYTSSIRKA